MLFFKKIILLTLIGAGAGVPIYKAYGVSPENISMVEFDSTIKKWKNILASVPGDNNTEKVSLLFSKNLTTFSKNTIENIVKQLLVKWIIQIWENPHDFHPISQRVKKFFFDYQHNYWKAKNNLDDLSWDLVKKFFIDFFYKEKGWFLLKQHFGDFRNFVYKEWKKEEKPFIVYEWTVNYTTNGKGERIFQEEQNNEKGSTKPYLFPLFERNQEYIKFITYLQNGRSYEAGKFERKILTVSELQKIQDGRKLAIMLHLLNLSDKSNSLRADKISVLDLSNSSDNRDYRENPLLLFLEKSSNSDSEGESDDNNKDCILVDKSLFKEEFQKKIPIGKNKNNEENICLYGIREIKPKFGTKIHKLFASREKDGISFYKIPSSNFERTYTKFDSLDETTSKELEEYLKNNFENIFFKYLLSKKDSSQSKEKQSNSKYLNFKLNIKGSEKEWNINEYFSKHSEVFDLINKYLEQLYWVDNTKKFLSTLASTYKEVPTSFRVNQSKESKGSNGDKILLKKEDGLFNPLPFERQLNNSNNEEEIEFHSLRGEQEKKEKEKEKKVERGALRKNDGFYTNLFSSLIKNMYELEEKAHNLREHLSKKDGKDFEFSSLEGIFKNNSLNRAQLEKISENKALLINSIFSKKIEDQFKGFGESNENWTISDKISNAFSFISGRRNNEENESDGGNDKWVDLVDQTLFLKNWLELPTEERSIFGTFKVDQDNSGEEEEQSEGNSKKYKSWITKAKNSWILRNFYLSDQAYESNSKGNKELLSFVYSIYWLTKDNYSNLSKLINILLDRDRRITNKNAYLVWLKEIDQKKYDELIKNENGGSNGDNKEILKKLSSSFTGLLPTDLMNPLIMGNTEVSGNENSEESSDEEEDKKDNSVKNIREYHSNATIFETTNKFSSNSSEEESDDMKLSGFLGFISPNFSTRKIPEELKKNIFEKFWIHNNAKNTNYAPVENSDENKQEEERSQQNNSKIFEGIFYEDNWKTEIKNNGELKELINALKQKGKIKKFINQEDPIRPSPVLLQALNSILSKENKDIDIDRWTIKELKENIIKVLDSSENSTKQVSENSQDNKDYKNIYKMWNRFSGFLQNDPQTRSPYIFTTEKGGKSQHYLTFLYQVNRFDFTKENIDKLKGKISGDTLDLLVALLASNKEAREWIYDNELIKQLNI